MPRDWSARCSRSSCWRVSPTGGSANSRAVAPCGTSLTDDHVRQLKNFARTVTPPEPVRFEGDGPHVVGIDTGVKLSIVRQLREHGARRLAPQAAEALRRANRAVHLDDIPAPGPRVQQVDVLRNDRLHETQALERRDRLVCRVRLRVQEHVDALAVEAPDALGIALERLDLLHGHLELVSDPRVGTTLSHPPTDLVKLRTQRPAAHEQAGRLAKASPGQAPWRARRHRCTVNSDAVWGDQLGVPGHGMTYRLGREAQCSY